MEQKTKPQSINHIG